MIFFLKGLSRLIEHRHYGVDVLAGCILGGVIAIIAVGNDSLL